MNSKKINIIHPKDDTTDFLEEIYLYLKENTSAEINVIRLTTKEDHSSFFEFIHEIDNNELILFLGHGTSSGLSGARTNFYQSDAFITERQLSVFKNKNLILLSCRSNQYLNTYFKDCGLKSSIGFPNLITDFQEIEEHDDPKRVEDITKEDIELFKNSIVNIVKYSLEDFILNNLTVFQLFNRIKLRTNKRIIKFYIEISNQGKLPLGKMLNDMVDGLIFLEKNI